MEKPDRKSVLDGIAQIGEQTEIYNEKSLVAQ